ncbi:MAG TPA: cupin-like domain-containing protein [Polyangiaceae bacterium]|nr:cupin-like domain-containing protein [Polyangiaceae bacterium]
MKILGEIARVSGLTRSEFEERFANRDEPVVVTGGIRSWPAVARWNVEYLSALMGDTVVRFKQSATNQHPDFHQATLGAMFARGQSRFSELLRAMTTGPREERSRRIFTGDEQFVLQKRNGVTTLAPELERLYADVEMPTLFDPERIYSVWAWFSGPGVRTWLHYDNNGCHNLNGQILGTKRCLLFAPSELERLYPFPPGGTNPAHNCAAVDVDAPDFGLHPRFADAGAWSAELGPGDLLFIPAWWLHTFAHTGDLNANVNFWWNPERVRDNDVSRWQEHVDASAAARKG